MTKQIVRLVCLAVAVSLAALVLSACGSSKDTAKESVTTKHGELTLGQVAEIQPGLGTVMIEYGQRLDNLWFAAQKQNWDMVDYQIKEMTEIQEVAEATRAKRAPMLKAFEHSFLDPLSKASQAKKIGPFTTAYDKAVSGCNACHASSTDDAGNSFKFIKIKRPTAPDFNNVDFAGQK